MCNYRIVTDSTTDLSPELIKKADVDVICLKYYIDGTEYVNHPDGREMSFPVFYSLMKNGSMCTTSQVNPADYEEKFSKILSEGKDILYIAFSSALSSTYASALIAKEELENKFPQRNIVIVDSKAASMGEGLLVYLASKKRDEGMDIFELAKWVEDTREHLCHWFTVNDLFFLKRGGRVSSASAIIGSALDIKPVLHVDDDGRLIPVKKVRGRKKSLNTLLEKMKETAILPEEQTIFISHGDCKDDVDYLVEQIKRELPVKEICVNYIGPVIGSHSGPGTVALFFVGSKK